MIKISSKAPLFKLNSTDDDIYSLKDSLGKYVVLYFYQKMTHQDVQLRPMISIDCYLNLKK